MSFFTLGSDLRIRSLSSRKPKEKGLPIRITAEIVFGFQPGKETLLIHEI